MKTITFCSAMLAVLLLASSASYANSENNETKEVKITTVENSSLGKDDLKAWVLNYASGEKPVSVTLKDDKEGRSFVVRSEYFEIAYVAGKKGFGAKRLPMSISKIPYEINSVVLNDDQIKAQRVLAPNTISDDEAVKLIVSYLPDLLNDKYKHLLN